MQVAVSGRKKKDLWEIRNLDFAATEEIRFRLMKDAPNGVEFAGVLLLPASVDRDFRLMAKRLLCGLDCQPFRIAAGRKQKE